ncbi:hypothetical protein, variant [Capsaspora owczarzaki ATCC 30864]|uniref:Secreted protein n=1 Tax=Capsaspora owczarzaki (strain ATCC 30864) TaxID=595528 RepID=A0A0D2WSA2_CAPO3|nr:hypothetical protein CAOG_009864 [Capsaspora owczarzaki ATCC 30864]KJE94990.1 hypothetical protein, variant [Capsaspora owczarzaki ATCC 30864]
MHPLVKVALLWMQRLCLVLGNRVANAQKLGWTRHPCSMRYRPWCPLGLLLVVDRFVLGLQQQQQHWQHAPESSCLPLVSNPQSRFGRHCWSVHPPRAQTRRQRQSQCPSQHLRLSLSLSLTNWLLRLRSLRQNSSEIAARAALEDPARRAKTRCANVDKCNAVRVDAKARRGTSAVGTSAPPNLKLLELARIPNQPTTSTQLSDSFCPEQARRSGRVRRRMQNEIRCWGVAESQQNQKQKTNRKLKN